MASTFVSNMRKVKIDFTSRWLVHYKLRPQDHKDPFILSSQENNKGFSQTKFMIRNLPTFLKYMPKLESLYLETPVWKSESEIIPPILDSNLLSALTQALVDGLTFSNLDDLTTLDLLLPCTHDFVSLSSKIPETTFRRLRHLRLQTTDATGKGGSRDYIIHASRNDDNDEYFLPSNLQQQYPNRVHKNGIFDFVSLCPNLTFLEISGTHFLDGNAMTIPASLESLKLHRVRFDASILGTLLSPPLQVSKVWLEDVELTGGVWNDVWKALLLNPSLTYLYTELCSYARSNPWCALLRSWGLGCISRPEIVTDIDAGEEYNGLRTLINSLVAKAGGRELYPDAYVVDDRCDM